MRRPNFFPQNLNFKNKKIKNAGSLEKIQNSSTQYEFIIYHSYGQNVIISNSQIPKKSTYRQNVKELQLQLFLPLESKKKKKLTVFFTRSVD
jgi:hypothetical protein